MGAKSTFARTLLAMGTLPLVLGASGDLVSRMASEGPARRSTGGEHRVERDVTRRVSADQAPPVLSTTEEPLRVLLMGDSLTHEAASAFTTELTTTGRADVDGTFVYGGTAICDWIPRLDAKLQEFRPDVAVVEFSGNRLTPCMIDPATGVPYEGAAHIRKYLDDASTAMEIFTRYGVTVYWVEAPITKASSAHPLRLVYQRVAWIWANGRYVDGGAAVLDDGEYADYLPCLADEPCTDTDPTTGLPAARVRAPDGAHFCPIAAEARDGVTTACPVWSSGAWRFGTAMANPVIEDYALTAAPPEA